MPSILLSLVALLLLACAHVPTWSEQGEAAAARGDLEDATAFYELAVEEHPDDPALTARLAALLERRGAELLEHEPALAVARFERALVLAPDTLSPTFWERRAHAYLKASGSSEPARRAALEDALSAGVEEPAFLRILVVAYDEEGRVSEAALLLERLEVAEAITEPERLRLAQLQSELGEVERAAATYRRYLERNPTSSLARVALSRILEEQGAIEDAESLLVEVAQAQPDRPRAWRDLMEFYLRHGRAPDAAEARARLEALTQPPERDLRPLR